MNDIVQNRTRNNNFDVDLKTHNFMPDTVQSILVLQINLFLHNILSSNAVEETNGYVYAIPVITTSRHSAGLFRAYHGS